MYPRVMFTLTPETKAALEEEARLEHRSQSYIIRLALCRLLNLDEANAHID